ncbi:MAG: non-canonical purine NTP pyrophosphatase [Paludibacteraceae bacterium]|nr:non-canonical purine NTP pyrophosphatase [Paludibacteraceae bacterium]
MTLVFASNNAHKLEEARAIMPNVHILSLAEIGCHEDIPETHPTLEGNSLQKAAFVRDWCEKHSEQIPKDVAGCFADDTGLEIEALNGDPGVYTARWAGPQCEPGSNRKKALRLLQNETNRKAQFRTIVTLMPLSPFKPFQPDTPFHLFEGIVTGRIATEERGNGGFGYDPVFIPDLPDAEVPNEQTFAELPIELKNTISHRARAMQQLAEFLQKIAK